MNNAQPTNPHQPQYIMYGPPPTNPADQITPQYFYGLNPQQGLPMYPTLHPGAHVQYVPANIVMQQPPMESNLPSIEEQQPTINCRTGSCVSKRISTFVKENRLFTSQIVVYSIMTIMLAISMGVDRSVGFFGIPKILLGLFSLIAIGKKKPLALSFFSGALLIDFLYMFAVLFLYIIANFYTYRGYSYSSYSQPFTIHFAYQLTIHILEITMIVLSTILAARIYKETHSTQVPQQEQVVPVMNTEGSANESYSRLEEEEGRVEQNQARQYYPTANAQNYQL